MRTLFTVSASIVAAISVAFYWSAGTQIYTVLNSMIAPSKSVFGWTHFALLVSVAAVFSVIGIKHTARPIVKAMAVFSIAWMILSVAVAKLAAIDLMAIPVIFAAGSSLLISHLVKLWKIDSALTTKLVSMASNGGIVAGNSSEQRIEIGLRLLETIFPVSDVIIFKLDSKSSLVPIGRARKEGEKKSSNERNVFWQNSVNQCEEALAGRETVVRVSEYQENAATLAVPLICDHEIIGVLFVDIKDDYEPGDTALLESFASQLARNFQRTELKSKNLPHSTWWSSFSTKSSENRVHLASLINELIKEKSFGALATARLEEAHAVAYLDGTLAYLNTRICELAGLSEEELPGLDLFSLLDRFRTLVFNDPSLAIRRVLQTGSTYACELEFPDTDVQLQLRIIPVKLPIDLAGNGTEQETLRPACLLITLQNIATRKENERLRSDMASLMSHELRTPITSINGFAEMLLLDGNVPAEAREYLSIISSEAQRASSLLSNYLTVTNLEQADKKEVDLAPVSIDSVVREVVEEMQDTAKKKRIRIVAKQDNEIPPVAADRGLITKAIMHLVDNAIKYSPERTSVIISTILETDFLKVEVEDRGYGIPKGEHEKIWQKFYRVARDGQSKEEESTGLGLSLVKEIAEQHKGEVSVASAVGGGSRFSFRLPRL